MFLEEIGHGSARNVSEQTVMQVAAAWSLDPTTLHLVESSPRTGICGTMAGRA